jgi:beta-glucosidase
MQCGGWSLRWQGFNGNDLWSGQNKVSSNASSLLDAFTNFKNSAGAKVSMLII